MSADLDLRERRELCDLFDELGPDAPTLCEGWSTADLAAHLVVREHDPRSGPGILFGGRFEGYTEKLMAKELQRGYPAVVERVRKGPPFPLSISFIRSNMNFIEFVVHFEDVRRANGLGPRTDRPELDDAVWNILRRMARFQFRKVKPFGVTLVRSGPGGPDDVPTGDPARIEAVGGSPTVTITGGPVDLLLFGNGRKDAAQVSLDGPDDAVAALRAASMGI